MAQDKLDILYDALERDGAVTRGRENFRAKMLAPGEEGYKNRLALFTALKQDNAVKSNTYEEFSANLGLHAVKPAKKEDPAEEQGGAAQPNADDYARAAKNNALAVERGRDVLHQAENAQEWQKANFGLNVPKVELGLGKSGRTVATAPTFNAKTGKQERTYITQSGNEYTSQASAEREQAALDKQQEQSRKLAHVQEEIDRKRQEELAGIDKQLTVMREQYDRIKGTDQTSETRRGYIMQAIDRLQQQRDAAEKKYRGRDVKAEYELGGGREQLEAAKEEVAKALEDIEERRGEKSGFMEFAESQFPNVTSYIRRWTDPEYGKAKAAEQALEDTENTIKQATREGFSNNTAFNVARGAWDATRDIRTWDFGANDWADSRNLAELVDKSERIRKAEEAGKTPEEHLTATEQRVLDAMAVSSTLDANFSEHVPMSYRVGQSVPASAGFAASIYLNPLNGLGAAVEKKVAANAAKGGMKEVLKGAMKTAGKTVMKNVTGAPTMNAAEQSMQRALTVAAVNKYGKWGVRAMNTAGRVIGDGVEALGTTLTTGLPRTMASINERQTGTFIGRVDDSGRIVYDRVEDRETGAKSYLKGGLASYFENQSELVGEYFSPIKNFANLAAKDMPLARSMVERFIASSPKQKASLLAEFRKKAHISGLFGEYAEEVINNLENAVFTGDMNLTGGVFEPKREDYQSEEDYNKAMNDWKGSMFNAETNLETFLSVAAMIMPMAAIEQGQKRYNSYTVKRQLNTSADALRKSLGEETAVPLMTRMREAESIKDICDVYMSVLKDGGLKDSEQARALMDYAGKLVAYQSVNTSDMSGEISANRVQRGYKSAFDAGHEMAADERHNAAVEFDNAAATATEMLGKDFVMAVRDMDLPHFQEILKTLNWEQKKAATDVYLSSVRLSGIMAGARDRVDEEADKYGNTLNLMSDEEGNAWRGSNLGENEYVVPSSLSDEGGTLVVRDMETGALRMIPREEAGELTAVNASEETEARLKQLWEQAKDEVRWNLNHHNKTVQPAVGETVSISIRKSEDEDNETQRFLIVKEDEDGNFYLLPTRMNEAGEEEAISGTPFKATADELLSSQDYVYEQEDAVQRDAERSAVEETTEGGATEETPTDGFSVVIEGTPATEEDAPADTAVPTRSEVAAQLDATEEGRSARAMVDGWVRDENDAETIHEWIDIVDESEWDAKTKQLLHDYVDSKDAPDEEGPTGGSSAVVESEAAPVVEGEATPAVESKATPKIPLDKNGVPQYDKAPVQATVEDLYDGTLDDKEVGEFIEAQIAEADKNVKKLEKRKPKVGTDKAKYLTSKKKWEDELEDARHKAQYWNDVKAEVERITTPADAQGWEGELNDDNARAAYRAQRKAENGIPTQQEFIADFMASAKIAPESFRKETGGGTLEQKQWAGRIAKEGDSIERLSEKLVDLDNTENGGRFFGGDSAAARDAIIDFLKSGRDKTDQEQEFVEQYNAQRDAYYNERYGMSYEDYIAYTEQEMPEMLRRYSNFDEQEFTKLYADEIEEDLRRREEQAKQQNNGTEGNDSAGEEQSDGGSHQVQPGERTDDTRGGEERTDTRTEEDAGDEGAGKPEAAQENAGAEAAGGRTANVGGTPELQGDIPSEERVAKREKSSATNEHDSQGNPLNADGTLKLEKVESIDDITDEDFSHPTRNVELPRVPENVGNTLGTDGKPVIIKKNIFERNAERHKDLSPSQSRGILFSALYNADLYGQNQKAKRPYNWVVINTKDEKGHNRIVLLEINPSKNSVEIVHWHYVNDKNLELIKKQAIREGGQVLILPSENSEEVGGLSNLTDGQQVEKNDGELVMLSSKDKVESLSTPQHDLSSDGKGSTKLPTEQEKGNIIPPSKRFNSRKADERYQRGKDAAPVTKEEAILRDAVIDRMRENGMDVITNEEEGQRVLDEAKNYVIFNGKDAKITDHVRFFRTADGEAYGFTVDGKIYIDPKIANSETPVHEYAHLWASALRQSNAKEWANVVGLMKDTAVWEEVKKRYPELTTDDEIADEVLATYSGRKGAERLRKEMEETTKQGSIFDKAEAMSAMQKIRQALDTFWKSVADFLHIHYTTAEEVADRVMKDLLDGVDPRMMNDGESVESIRYQHVESKEYESPERANERFNDELDAFKNKSHKGLLHLGRPGAILRAAGIDVESITLSPTVLNRHLNKHALTTDDLKGLAKSIQSPILVYKHGKNSPNIVVVTELDVKGGKLSASFELDSNGEVVKVSNISSIHNKDAEKELLRLYKMGEKDFRNALKWVEKEKMLNWLAPSSYKPSGMQTNEAPFDIAKVIQDFENPKVSDEKVSEDDLYRVVDDKETIERLDAEPKITAYRALQVIDGKLYSPMAAKVDGKLTDSNPHGTWTEAEETLFDFTPEQKAAMEALDKSNEPGNVELIKGKLRYNKQSKNGKGTFQFHLVKGDGSSLWAAYNPYIHSSLSMLNDQFTSAYKRPNIVVVEVEIPESELTSGYRAQNAKNTVGMTEWKAGPVAGQLPSDMARQVMLSRWSKVKRIVPYSEVADQVAATLSIAEEKTGQKVQLPIDSFHPELRKELEKRGFEFQYGKYTEETAKRKAWDDLTDEEKQQAYKGAAYMDDAAIEALNSEYSGEWLKREGEGQATDEEVSLANDPVSKMIGKSRYSAGQQIEYAENMRERMTTHAQELAEKLHLSNVEIAADGSGFTGKRQKAKGFYNKTTGKITVIIGNHTSMADVEKTILHEAVAHHGLRQLFGEHFDQFLDNVYESCDYKIRQKIDALMEEKGYDQRTATEEYLASLAEDMNYETTDPTFWTAIKEAFLDMLHTLGFDYAGPVLTDNELRYILWRSYKNLEEPGSFRSILGTAEDLKMQETLGVGQYETEGKESAAAEDLFREDDISRALNNDSEGAGWSRETMQRAWDDVMSKASFLAKEGYFDYLASVDEFQKLVERATGEKVSDMQNAYKAMLQLSSRNANEMKLFDSAFARPLQRAVYRLIGAVKDFKKGKGLELSWYLISKHGIERNRDMAIRAAMKEKAKESFAEQIHEATAELKEERTQLLTELTRIAAGETSPLGTEAAIKARVKQIEAEIDRIKKHPNKHGLKTEAEFYEDELDNWYRTASFIKEYAEENGWTWRETQEELTRRAADFGADVTEDYSGLSALVEEEEDFTEAAYRRVENYENTHYTDDLWESIRAMSGYSLEKQRSSGLTTKKYVDDQLRRYDFFVPLRGWADPTAEEMYDYLDGQRSELGNPVKTAKGRKSEADNPLGGLLSVAYRSIASGNKNMALQHFYNLVSAHNTSGLAVIDSMWIENRGTEDAPDWVLATPELTDPMTGGREMSAEEVQAELDRFNADMREKAALGMAIQMKKGTPLPPYRVTQQHARAHQIRLSVGGTNRVITIVGNPRVAMALNGLLKPENSGWPILRKLNNFMAGAFTNYNVSFGGANLARDTAHSNLRAFIGESPAYWWALTKKQNLMLGNVANWARMVGMLRKYEAGKPMTGYHERMFKEFMDGGGATGYTMIRNQKESTQFMVDMVRDLKNIKRRKLSPMRMFEFFSFLNEAAELVNRFVAYETSREMGRTRERSIDDAKEATLNFNRKGAGAKSLTQREGAKYRLSNALNYYSQYGRSFIVFFNAHVQGTYQLYRLVKEHPAKFAFAFGAAPVTAAAVALPLFNNLLLPAIYSAVGGDGDDDWGDYYYELSDWERQHNICLRLPKGYGWLKIPLTPELGAMFQVGDVTGASFAGKRDMQASDFAGIMELVAPNNVDFTDAGTAISSFVPSSLQWASHIAVNRDFKGSRLRNDNMFSRYQPEYLKATRSTSATITAMSRALNKVGGGNDERSADNVLDFSPGYVQEMLTGIAGGWASTALAVSDALAAPYLEGGGSEKDYWKGAKGLFDRGGVPVLSRFWISGSGERNAARAKGEYMRTVKPFMGATESEFSLIKRIPRPAALDVRAKEEKLEAAKKSHDLFAIAEAEKSLEAAKANFEEAKKTQRQKLDALQGSERFKAYRDMRGITRYIDYMLRLYKDNDLPDNVVDSLQEANRRLLDVEK